MKLITCIFGFTKETVEEFLFGNCECLAYSLYKIMKTKKLKCQIYYTSSNEYPFVHVVVFYKNKYIDVLGIHSYDELATNHSLLYDIPPDELYIDKFVPSLHTEKMEWHKSIEIPYDWNYFEKCAYDIYYSREMQNLIRPRLNS